MSVVDGGSLPPAILFGHLLWVNLPAMQRVGIGMVLLGVFFLWACGGDEGGGAATADSGILIIGEDATADADAEVDAGIDPVDTGPIDTGPRDCSSNPFSCAPMQLLDANCNCLQACEGDLVWNPSTNMCEPPFPGDCGMNDDCPGADDVCLNPPSQNEGFTSCNLEPTCACFTSCDPFTDPTMSGCPAGQNGQPLACTHLLDADVPVDALCLNPGTGGQQDAVCDQFASCDRLSNYICIGLVGTATAGACQRLCDTADPTFCSTIIAGHTCNDFGFNGFPDIGLCGPPPLPSTDFGQTCVSNTQCAGACSPVLGGCTATCDPPATCSSDSTCITFTGAGVPPDQRRICMSNCSSADATGDVECQARNPLWICDDIVANSSPLCTPGCTQIGCPAGQTCDTVSRRCI